MAKPRRGNIINRRHLAREQREQLQNNWVLLGSLSVVAVVLILVVAALIIDQVVTPNQPVATVNGVEISTREFQARVRFERNNLVSQYLNMLDLANQFGADPNSQAFFTSQLNQLALALEPESIGRDVLNGLVEEELIRQEAERRGISVSPEEVQAGVDEFFGYFGGAQAPTPTVPPTAAPTSTLSPLQMTLTAPTATPTLSVTSPLTDTGVLTDTAEITDTETLGEPTPEIEITDTEPFTPTATPTAFTEDAYQGTAEAYFGFIDARLSFTEDDLYRMIEAQLLREKMSEVITTDLSEEQDQVWARHILLPDEAAAQEVIERLDDGEDFYLLALELSQDDSNSGSGGDLGWFSSGAMVSEFEKVAFQMEVGDISEPVITQFGAHVIQVLGHEIRTLNPTDYSNLINSTFQDWATGQRLQADVVIEDYWAERVPTSPSIPPNAQLGPPPGAQPIIP
jgi:parvulin-like peptidyl-prolyl isomerase